MNLRKRAWLLVALAVVLAVAAIAGIWWTRTRAARTEALLRRIPTRDAVLVSIDFAALRQAGILQMLAGSKGGEEAEYKSFVSRTKFNYRDDLDTAIVAFAPNARYFLLRGRFDWKAMRDYAAAERGYCDSVYCNMPGSTPDRQISFFAVQTGIMGLAVTPQQMGATALASHEGPPPADLPEGPVWVSIPPAALRSGEGLPSGTRMFARGVENAESVILTLGADGQRFAARLTVRCRSGQEAAAMAADLNKTTNMLRDLIAREHQQANPADLSGVLTSGSFRAEGRRVSGFWPIERSFLDHLLADVSP